VLVGFTIGHGVLLSNLNCCWVNLTDWLVAVRVVRRIGVLPPCGAL
jgi:hypothetical protein